MKRKFFTTRTMATLAVLTAVGYGLSWLEFPLFPGASFLKLDFSTFITLFGGYMFGFPGAVVIEGIKQLLIWGTKSSTGGIGEIANFIMAVSFVAVPTVLYRFKKGRGWVSVGLVCGCVCQMGVSMLCNRYITFPLFSKYLGMTAAEAFASLWPYVLGFNAIKSVSIAALVFLLYKKLSYFLKKYILEPAPKHKREEDAPLSAPADMSIADSEIAATDATHPDIADHDPAMHENPSDGVQV